MSRPKEPVPQKVANSIIEWISDGKPLREFCRQKGAPNWRTVYLWLEKDDEFRARFAQARDMGADAIAEEALEILDQFPLMADGKDGSRIDSGHVSWMKNRFEGRLKLLSKWNPNKYGDKLDVTSKGEQVGLAINIDLGGDK